MMWIIVEGPLTIKKHWRKFINDKNKDKNEETQSYESTDPLALTSKEATGALLTIGPHN